MFRLITMLLAAVLLAGCATPHKDPPCCGPAAEDVSPSLRLTPASLGREMALQQRLEFFHGDRRESIEAMVEVDAGSVRVAMHAQGQVALRLDWDGHTLDQSRAEWLPPVLTAERVLDDLQLVYWPAVAIKERLPAGWHLVDTPGSRRLLQDGEIMATVIYVTSSHARLRRQTYVLDIHSVPVAP